MKKQTKVLVTLSAAALLAVGASAITFAEGWDNSTGVWQYLDKDGEPVTDEWKPSNGQYFWLDDDGNMATDSVIEDNSENNPKYYYVDANGARVSNTWKAVAKDDDDDSDAEYYWMYFGSDGKAYTTKEADELTKSKIKTINGLKYVFDEKGHMLYGWISKNDKTQHDSDEHFWSEDAVAYYGNGWNDGHLQTGWVQLSVLNDEDEEKDYWFYFDSDGVMQKNKVKKINGVKYSFAKDGHMLDEWVVGTNSVESKGQAKIASYMNGDGAQRKNKWVWAIPDENFNKSDNEDDEYRWFYLNSSGKLTTDTIKKINGKKYIFDAVGIMKKNFGYVKKDTNDYVGSFKNDKVTRDSFLDTQITVNDDDKTKVDLQTYDLYYFSDDEKKDGSMKKGYQTITLDDDTYQFYFNTSTGKAENGYNTKIKKFVANGLVLKPTDDEANYVAVKATLDDIKNEIVPGQFGDTVGVFEYADITKDVSPLNSGYYVGDKGYVMINKSGTVVKNKSKLKDENDHYYVVNKNGVVVLAFNTEDDYDDYFDTKKHEGVKAASKIASGTEVVVTA